MFKRPLAGFLAALLATAGCTPSLKNAAKSPPLQAKVDGAVLSYDENSEQVRRIKQQREEHLRRVLAERSEFSPSPSDADGPPPVVNNSSSVGAGAPRNPARSQNATRSSQDFDVRQASYAGSQDGPAIQSRGQSPAQNLYSLSPWEQPIPTAAQTPPYPQDQHFVAANPIPHPKQLAPDNQQSTSPRKLATASRKPAASTSPAAPISPALPVSKNSDLRVKAILSAGGKHVVLLRLPDGAVVRANPGDSFATTHEGKATTLRVIDIDDQTVRVAFSHDSQERILR